MLERSRQVEVVGRAFVDGNAHALAVDVSGRAERRILWHHVDAFNDDVRRREGDLGGADWLDSQKYDVERASLESVERLAGRIETDQFDGDVKTSPEFAREIDSDAFEFARSIILLCQDHVAQIDRDPKLVCGREILHDVGGSIHNTASLLTMDNSRQDFCSARFVLGWNKTEQSSNDQISFRAKDQRAGSNAPPSSRNIALIGAAGAVYPCSSRRTTSSS